MAKVPVLYQGVPLLNESGLPVIYDDVLYPDGPPEACCCPTGCDTCPCCTRCPSISSSIDLWIEGQVQDPDYDGVCDCAGFTTPETDAFDSCTQVVIFGISCDNSLTFEVVREDGVCYMRAVLSGDSTSSGGGGLWSVTWEKNLGPGPIECSDLHELDYVSSTGGANIPCDFTASTLFADILIP
jgi:hypothetical protein